MDITESINMSLRTLAANRLRSLLTVLGIIIGNASVIAMVGIGQGAQRYTSEQLQALGTNLLFVLGGTGDARRTALLPNTLTLADADAIAKIPTVKEVSPQITNQSLVSYRSTAARSSVVGVVPAFGVVRNFQVAQGRFINAPDLERNAKIAVLGSQLAGRLFGDRSPLGESVRINNISFRVVGVMEEKGAAAGNNQDEAAYVPLTTMANLIAGRNSPLGITLGSITVAAQDDASVDIAEYQIANLLRLRHKLSGVDDFTVRNQKDTLTAANNVTGGLTILLSATAGISLLVGGIGIMNIMLASVTERTAEIGLRKALGATRVNILQQFLIEATILSIVGGLVGTGLGCGTIILVRVYSPLQADISISAIGMAVGASGAIGMIFGVVPAQRAARLDPIVALRNL